MQASGVNHKFSLYHFGPPSAASLTHTHVGMRTALGMVTIFAAKEGTTYLATICSSFDLLSTKVPSWMITFPFAFLREMY
jgi:hypothetical protein